MTIRAANSTPTATCAIGGLRRTAANYEERDKCIQDEYTQEVPEAGVKQNGKLVRRRRHRRQRRRALGAGALQNTLKSQGKDLDTPAPDGLTESQNFFLALRQRLVRGRPSGSRPHCGHDAGALAESVSGEQRDRQHARIRPRLRLSRRTAHGACQRVPGVVNGCGRGRPRPCRQ